ncbi:MAG: DUF418 domain-containing protein [Actinomycetota bacterium]|nr:DUF418 domain-containing protein [Actinomycetota bacterium]
MFGNPPRTNRKAVTPVGSSERITSLDAVRGVAALGILVMNAVSFGLVDAAYYNLDAGGSDSALDWVIGFMGEILVDQKMMAVFSLLFGIGVVVFAERATAKARMAGRLSMWRFLFLALIGILHTLLWEGDILFVYAICAPVVLLLRNRRPRTLAVAGAVLALLSAAAAVVFQAGLDPAGADLGDRWFGGGDDASDELFALLLIDGFGRALGLMLIGVALYRWGIPQGRHDAAFYHRVVAWGFGIGLPLAGLGVVVHQLDDWSGDTALTGDIPNTIATIPMALGYVALIVLWNQQGSQIALRLRDVGRMALTNYLTQSLLGVLILTNYLGDVDLSRTAVAGFILAVCALQLWWSPLWLRHFRFGPVEWAWRCATYRSWQPLRRVTPD